MKMLKQKYQHYQTAKKTLLIISMALFGFTFLITMLVIILQEQFIASTPVSSYVQQFVFPWSTVFALVIFLGIYLLFAIKLIKKPNDDHRFALEIVAICVIFFFDVVVLSIVGVCEVKMVHNNFDTSYIKNYIHVKNLMTYTMRLLPLALITFYVSTTISLTLSAVIPEEIIQE